MDDQPIGSAVEGEHRFIFANAFVQAGKLIAGDVRRVGDDQIKRSGIDHFFDRVEQIADLDHHAVGQTQLLDVFFGNRSRLFTDIGRQHDCGLQIFRNRGGDATAARAEIQHPWCFQPRLMPNGLQNIFHQRFGIGPGDEHIAIDRKFKAEEMRRAGEISDRLLLATTADEIAKLRQLRFANHFVIAGVQLNPGDVQHMRQQQLGGKPRLVDALLGEKAGCPFEQSADGPCRGGFGHGRKFREWQTIGKQREITASFLAAARRARLAARSGARNSALRAAAKKESGERTPAPCYCMDMSNWKTIAEQIGINARKAALQLAALDGETRSAALRQIAESLRAHSMAIYGANGIDLDQAHQAQLAPAMIERLKLDPKKIAKMAESVEGIAAQPEPVGQIIESHVRPDGLEIVKLRVPLGVVLFLYESRPNVTGDAAALCLKSGNAVILRGGKEALQSNMVIAAAIGEGLRAAKLDPMVVQLVTSTDRALVPQLLKLDKYIDLVIPRGGESLIRAVVAESSIPVLKHFTGNCHVYVDAATESMEQQVRDICVNAKTGYPGGGVCNAAEKIIFHRAAADRLLVKVCEDLAAKKVEIRGDESTRKLFPSVMPATEEDWHTEYLSFTIAIKVVDSLEQAIDHINQYGSRHTDAILSTDAEAIDAFVKKVDSASIMVNASTRFADGGEYGLGAEIGISTDKLHARGPMGAMDLTTYKWVVTGNGHVRG